MEGSRFFNSEQSKKASDFVCLDCGNPFVPRRVTDGVEELCDTCYEARFPSAQALFKPSAKSMKHALAAD